MEKQNVEQFNEDEELNRIKSKKAETETQYALSEKINNTMQECYDKVIAENPDKMQQLTKKFVDAEFEVREAQLDGKKQVYKNEAKKAVSKSKQELDEEEHKRSKAILKSFGYVEKLPWFYRWTALIIGYPIFLLYTITLGAIVSFLTFSIKGIITMIFDCAEKFNALKVKFMENTGNKEFKLGKALFNILKWVLIVGAVITIAVLLIVK